jgi:hypothetical protein
MCGVPEANLVAATAMLCISIHNIIIITMFRLLLAFAVATAGHSAPSTFVSGESYAHRH